MGARRISAAEIADGLRARPCGRGRWQACCPAHDDHSPSLSIREGDHDRVLVRCWAGCTQDAVIAALAERGLWNTPGAPREGAPAREWIPRSKVDHARMVVFVARADIESGVSQTWNDADRAVYRDARNVLSRVRELMRQRAGASNDPETGERNGISPG